MPDTDTMVAGSVMLLNIIILSDTKHLSLFLIRTSTRSMEIYELEPLLLLLQRMLMHPKCIQIVDISLKASDVPRYAAIVSSTIPEQSPGDTAQVPNNSSALHRDCDPRPVSPPAQPSPAQPGDPRLLFPINCEMCEQRPVYL